MAEVQRSEPKTLPGIIFRRVFNTLGFLLLALVLAVVVEWIGMTFFWEDEGVDHSRHMVVSELEALDLAVSPEAVASLWVAGLARSFVAGGYELIARKTGIETAAVSLSQWTQSEGIMAYAESALNSIQAFLLRLVVVVLAMPAFIIVAIMCSVEGLSRRALRRYGGGHETAYVFHHAKRVLAPSIFLPVVIYLSWPAPLSPLVVFAPALIIFGIAVTVTVSKFKKFL